MKLPNFFLFIKWNARSIQEKYLKNCHFLFWAMKMTSNMKNNLKINLKNTFWKKACIKKTLSSPHRTLETFYLLFLYIGPSSPPVIMVNNDAQNSKLVFEKIIFSRLCNFRPFFIFEVIFIPQNKKRQISNIFPV